MKNKQLRIVDCFIPVLLTIFAAGCGLRSTTVKEIPSVIAPGAEPVKCADGFKFSEGPASDAAGNVYFSDYGNDRIHKWSLDGKLSTFKDTVGGPIGLYFDSNGNLLVCAAKAHRIKIITPKGKITEFPDRYHGNLFNSPNDIWVDPKGGIYFTDPRFAPLPEEVEQDGFHIYYIAPGGSTVIRAADDLTNPNGIVGSPDGRYVYVTDTPEDKTFVFTVNRDGTLSGKKLFAREGYDGMTVDSTGNIYITMQRSIEVYSPTGTKIESLEFPGRPTNVCFGGKNMRTLFVTVRSSLYSLRMRVMGL